MTSDNPKSAADAEPDAVPRAPADAGVDPLLDRIDGLLRDVLAEEAPPAGPLPQGRDALAGLLAELRDALVERDHTIEKMAARSESLMRAQADALVRSAETIDELETTKQRLADARLVAERAAEDNYRLAATVFENTNDGVLVFSEQRCIACNENAVRLLGGAREDIIDAWPAAFEVALCSGGEDGSASLRDAFECLTADKPVVVEALFPGGAGGEFWAEVTLGAFGIDNRQQSVVVVRDITTRKQFENELQRRRDFLRNILNAVPDQLAVTRDDQTLVLANNAFCEFVGQDRADVIGRKITDVLGPQSCQGFRDCDEQALEAGEFSCEHDRTLPNGERAVLSVKRSVFGDEQGDRYIVSTSRDITEDRLREERLRLLASVFNGASEGVAILTTEGAICEANPAFLTMTGATPRDVAGGMLGQLLNFAAGDAAGVLRDVALGRSWSGKACASHPTHGDRQVWVSLSPSLESKQRFIALVSDITELEEAQEMLRSQARSDILTGLPNRRWFRDHLQQLLDDPADPEQSVTVCFLDLDNFKHVNDTSGHAAGDMLLRGVGERIQRMMGPDAFLSRFGGDEFAMILTEPRHQPPRLLDTLKELLNEFRRPFHLEGTEATVGLSIGLVSSVKGKGEVGDMMRQADIAMYAAKSAGKNGVRVFSPEMEDGVNTRHQVQTRLRQALRGGEITLCFQPKVCAATRKPIGCEALARWRTPEGKLIPPSEFVPIAEQTGLIVPFGELVFRTAAEQARDWAACGREPSVAVNVSPHQLRHPGFVSSLQDVLAETSARAEWFELEITECAMMEDVDHAVEVIDSLAALGFNVAVDDFGTGYSSLSYLKHFRLHTLKIDLTFIRDVTTDWQSQAVVRSVVSLGAGLGLNVVAEGVETAEQAELLSEIGCTTLQGYYFGKPMTADDYVDWLDAQARTSV
ncbi:Cyclic di-GMP phosphodiesterase Gmr [Posidoniimonas polymericola]|uniref:Cyclic di-GMP phosphodiesterase Gmr n=1 Tax=Posidoniimonas polymericola TaxID=2528002 RepID=A0A5C5YSH0_9BACT|nr:bifunctional diguanylate cyclase/phosphodiesterase [Posidoniimonas polymericola]TWT77741.1 Cyclic di-GMP phosphodiesterase Gmr [Posidoniimonas polymericola]